MSVLEQVCTSIKYHASVRGGSFRGGLANMFRNDLPVDLSNNADTVASYAKNAADVRLAKCLRPH